MKHIANLKVGESKGNKRIWIEGKKLDAANFSAGDSIDVLIDKDSQKVTIRIADTGSKTVSSRKRKGAIQPIIDICNSTISKVFKSVRKIKAVFHRGLIIVSVHADEIAKKARLDRLNRKLVNGEPLTCGSIAHGGGILDNALHTGLSMESIKSFLGFGVEIEQRYLECSMDNNSIWGPESLAIESPMEEVDLSDIPQTDIFAAGIPCTGASIAGRSKNKLTHAEDHSLAGALFLSFLNIVEASNSAFVILENVVPYQNTASMSVVRSSLAKMGYTLHELVLNGCAYGALENRDRMVLIAVTEGIELDVQDPVPIRQKESCLGDILEPIADDSDLWKEFVYLKEK